MSFIVYGGALPDFQQKGPFSYNEKGIKLSANGRPLVKDIAERIDWNAFKVNFVV